MTAALSTSTYIMCPNKWQHTEGVQNLASKSAQATMPTIKILHKGNVFVRAYCPEFAIVTPKHTPSRHDHYCWFCHLQPPTLVLTKHLQFLYTKFNKPLQPFCNPISYKAGLGKGNILIFYHLCCQHPTETSIGPLLPLEPSLHPTLGTNALFPQHLSNESSIK